MLKSDPALSLCLLTLLPDLMVLWPVACTFFFILMYFTAIVIGDGVSVPVRTPVDELRFGD